ncbi:hypothetical protein TNIN_340461 [Trichonephila inaurata madagascariensis]|uniref:Uncharacterized protein n=1 Tax=Trichonephila inaurata madagascariensis TaxID=2747483 RepID=A0A8X6YXN8_9ARAC|nr:hypothetical protein TNIN_340461 [Trichonephila inaurata madagascariensis]
MYQSSSDHDIVICINYDSRKDLYKANFVFIIKTYDTQKWKTDFRNNFLGKIAQKFFLKIAYKETEFSPKYHAGKWYCMALSDKTKKSLERWTDYWHILRKGPSSPFRLAAKFDGKVNF